MRHGNRGFSSSGVGLFPWLWDKIRRVDPVLFFTTLALSVVGFLTVAGVLYGEDPEHSLIGCVANKTFLMQFAMTFLGIVCTVFLANMDYRVLVDKFYILMFVGSALFLGVTLIFGSTGESMTTANKSWLKIPGIGISVQPSEFVKITFVCTFAKHLYAVRDRINRPKTLLFLALHAGVIVGLILLSGDLGVALVYVGIIAVMLFCAGLSPWYFAGAAGFGALLFPYLWQYLREDQQKRILYGFNPEADPYDKGYQPLMSRKAIAHGGAFGQGFGGGVYYQNLTTGRLTDYIFSAVCEKFGFVGGFLVVGLYVLLMVRLVQIATADGMGYGRLICIGVAAVILVQTLESMGMCLAMLPVVGITLPFLSCGGSSTLATYILFGFVHSAYAHRQSDDTRPAVRFR